MAVVTPTAKTQFIGADGQPLVGGKLYTYIAGTTTPSPTYTDNTGATPNTNPVILDSRGEANIWLGESTYKFKLTDANDVEIWTVDYISAPTTALSPVLTGNVTISSDSSGPALKITQTGTGYVMRVQDSADPDLTPFVINSAGLVGLGTPSPAEALDIDNGKLQFSSSGTARTVISADATNSTIDVKDNRNFVLKTNGATQLTISGSGSATFAAALTVEAGGANITGNSIITGNGSVTGTFGVTGATSLTGNLTILSGVSERTVTLGSSGGYFYGNATQIGWKDSGNVARVYWDTSGNLTSAGSVTATTSVLVDTISERTASAGVTIAGVLCKNNQVAAVNRVISADTVKTSTSGTNVDFTSIPSWVKRVTLMFNGVSTNGSSQLRVRIGPVAGVETSGYLGSSGLINGLNLCSVQNFTAGFDLYDNGTSSVLRYGSLTLTLLDATTNAWVAQSVVGQSTTNVTYLGGYKPLAGALSIVRVTTVNGTDAFDAGSINILYE